MGVKLAMLTEQELKNFWNEEIRPRFMTEALEHEIRLLDGTLARSVYLDNAATTKPFKAVIERIVKASNSYGSVHRGTGHDSEQTTDEYDSARDRIRKYVGASNRNHVVFRGNTTDAINCAAVLWATEPGSVLISRIEHSSNSLPWKENGGIVQFSTGVHGETSLAEIERILIEHQGKSETERIKLIAITGSSNVTGYKPPVYDIANLAHKYGAKILVDVCQLIPHEKVDVLPDDDPRHLDFITFSSHKIYAPYGVGVLIGPGEFFNKKRQYQIGGGNLGYITSDLRVIRPFTERDNDPGTPNALGVFALDESLRQMQQIGLHDVKDYEAGLAKVAFERLREIPNVRIYVDYPYGTVVPFDVEGMPYMLTARILATEYGVAVRPGDFCVQNWIRMIKGIYDEEDRAIEAEVRNGVKANKPGIVRASLSIINNLDDIIKFTSVMREISRKGYGYYASRYQVDPKKGVWIPR